MESGKSNPSHLPHQNKKKQLHNDPIMALSLMKSLAPYNKIINDIGYDRFFVHYWTLADLNMYRMYTTINKTPIIIIDVTGGIVSKCKLISGRETSSIFLYQIGVMDKTQSQLKVAHMLSERHDNNSISHWLSEWMRNIITPPKIVVTNQSKELMIAVIKTFTQYSSLSKYLCACSSLLLKETKQVKIPNCMLRNDFNHTMKLLSSWTEIKNSSPRIKNFYLRSIGLVISSVDFNDAKLLLEHIFTVALNEKDGYITNNIPNACEISKKYLKERIESDLVISQVKIHNLNDKNEIVFQYTGLDESDLLLDELSDENSIFKIIQGVYNYCLVESRSHKNQGNHDNMEYCPMIAKKLLRFCKLIPCWSAVMISTFKYDETTSASSESLFYGLKNHTIKYNTIPIRVDDFIRTHIDDILEKQNADIDSCITVGNIEGKENNERKSSEQIKELQVNNDEIETSILLNEKIQHNKISTSPTKYNLSITNIEYLHEKQTNSRFMNLSLATINTTEYKKSIQNITINNKRYIITNTCAFDSLIHILFTSYADSPNYLKFIEVNIEFKLFEFISYAKRNGFNLQTYKKRAMILIDVYKSLAEYSKSPIHLDCSCTTHFVINNLFCNYDSLIENKTCSNCKEVRTRKEKIIVVKLLNRDLSFFLDVLKNMYSVKTHEKCDNCDSYTIKSKFTFGNQVFIELFAPPSKRKPLNKYSDVSLTLSKIPKKLCLDWKSFTLRGVINLIPPILLKSSAIGYYVSYCWREHSNRWERYDDLECNYKIAIPTTIIENCQFIIYTV
ncbi:unnamed protein product [Macrosiphum euphorbiae]|uniref:USP domain-containing protein n=1 Tax=Macrosiphum euphorbiae TaxID=13131 RepID=A0AAV0XE77_9HEMI|nr:unnamed protein product [Macrosiphum euphorbiae]